MNNADKARNAAHWLNVQKRGRDLGAYDQPFVTDSMLVDPDTGLPMDEEQARAHSELIRSAFRNPGNDEAAPPTS